MKSKTLAYIAIPVLAGASLISGCNMIKGGLEDLSWASKTVADTIQPSETTEVTYRNNRNTGKYRLRTNRK